MELDQVGPYDDDEDSSPEWGDMVYKDWQSHWGGGGMYSTTDGGTDQDYHNAVDQILWMAKGKGLMKGSGQNTFGKE